MSWWRLGEGSGYRGRDLALYSIECAFCDECGNWKRGGIARPLEQRRITGGKTSVGRIFLLGAVLSLFYRGLQIAGRPPPGEQEENGLGPSGNPGPSLRAKAHILGYLCAKTTIRISGHNR